MQLDKVVERYVALRDRKAELKAAYEASVADITTAMDRLENAILESLNGQGVESVRTSFGTAMKIRSVSVTTADKTAFMDFVRQNEAWPLLEVRPAKAAIEEYRASNDDLPPGINYKEAVTVGVRRS